MSISKEELKQKAREWIVAQSDEEMEGWYSSDKFAAEEVLYSFFAEALNIELDIDDL